MGAKNEQATPEAMRRRGKETKEKDRALYAEAGISRDMFQFTRRRPDVWWAAVKAGRWIAGAMKGKIANITKDGDLRSVAAVYGRDFGRMLKEQIEGIRIDNNQDIAVEVEVDDGNHVTKMGVEFSKEASTDFKCMVFTILHEVTSSGVMGPMSWSTIGEDCVSFFMPQKLCHAFDVVEGGYLAGKEPADIAFMGISASLSAVSGQVKPDEGLDHLWVTTTLGVQFVNVQLALERYIGWCHECGMLPKKDAINAPSMAALAALVHRAAHYSASVQVLKPHGPPGDYVWALAFGAPSCVMLVLRASVFTFDPKEIHVADLISADFGDAYDNCESPVEFVRHLQKTVADGTTDGAFLFVPGVGVEQIS